MNRWLPLFALSTACTTIGIAERDAAIDDGSWDGATLRIAAPISGSFLALEDTHEFKATLTGADGAALPTDDLEITWSASSDLDWARTGASFTEDALDVGLHELTVEVELPNGDRLAHTVGGVLLQSKYAGTYTGLFNTKVTYDEFPVDCTGAVTLIVDPWGEVAAGAANCLVSLLGFNAPIDFVFDLDNDDGAIGGEAAIDLFGWYGLSFPATGDLDPETGTLAVAFTSADAANQFIAVDGTVDADRISRDAGL